MSRADTRYRSSCFSPKNYITNIVFQTNVNNLLDSLTSNSEASGFYDDTVGAAPDRVYGLVICRGDLNSNNCGSCLRTAAPDIVRLCPYNKEAIIWYDCCLLPYADLNFFSPSSLNRKDMSYVYNTQNISQAEQTEVDPMDVVNLLVSRAPSTGLMYLPTDLRVGASATRYGMAQCTRDLSSGSCRSCLNLLADQCKSCCTDSMGWRVYHSNCAMSYEAYPFLFESNGSSPLKQYPPAPKQQLPPRKLP